MHLNIFKKATYRNLLLECDDGGAQVVDFNLALSETSDDVTVIEHSRVVTFVLLILRSRGVGVGLGLDW